MAIIPPSLKGLFFIFLKIGVVSLGRYEVVDKKLKIELVERQRWITESDLNEMRGVSNLIPGFDDFKLVLHTGYHSQKLWGLLVSGLAYNIPSIIFSTILFLLYLLFFPNPTFKAGLLGVYPVVLGILSVRIGKAITKSIMKPIHIFYMFFAALVSAFIFSPFYVIIGAGCFAMANYYYQRRKPVIFVDKFADEKLEQIYTGSRKIPRKSKISFAIWGFLLIGFTLVSSLLASVELEVANFYFFLGSFIFGTGYLAVPIIFLFTLSNPSLVMETQFIDVLALGLVTSLPSFFFVVFFSYLLSFPVLAIFIPLIVIIPQLLFFFAIYPIGGTLSSSKVVQDIFTSLKPAALGILVYFIFRLLLLIVTYYTNLHIFLLLGILLGTIIVLSIRNIPVYILIGIGFLIGIIV